MPFFLMMAPRFKLLSTTYRKVVVVDGYQYWICKCNLGSVPIAKIKIRSVSGSDLTLFLRVWSLALNYVQKLGPPSNWWPWIDLPRSQCKFWGILSGFYVEKFNRNSQELTLCRYLALCLPMKIDRCCCFWFRFPRYLLGF